MSIDNNNKNKVYSRIRQALYSIAKKLHLKGYYNCKEYDLSYSNIANGALAISYIRMKRESHPLIPIWDNEMEPMFVPNNDKENTYRLGKPVVLSRNDLKGLYRDVYYFVKDERSSGKPIIKEHLEILIFKDQTKDLIGTFGEKFAPILKDLSDMLNKGTKWSEACDILGLKRDWKKALLKELSRINPSLVKRLEGASLKASTIRMRKMREKRKAEKLSNSTIVESVQILPNWV